VPEIGEMWELAPGAPAKRLRTGPPEAARAVGRDWQNAYADLASSLKHRLEAIRDDAAREKAIAEMRKVLDSYEAFRAEKATRNGQGH
jgi:metallo-beta-lactamase family protein